MSDRKSLSGFIVGLVCLVAGLTGCSSNDDLNAEYGKITGIHGSDSLNGVSVLADMFSERGFRVKRRTKISPKINQYNTIVWFPNDYSCPSEEAIEALTDWLQGGYGEDRTLIYVGRDYDARTDYLSAVEDLVPVEQKEEIFRRLAEARFSQDNQEDSENFSWFDEDTTTCQWFEHKRLQRQKAKTLTGRLSSGVATTETAIELSTMLVPTQEIVDGGSRWESESWLEADGYPMVTELTDQYGEYDDSKILVVSNGSIMLNYALVNVENRKIARQIIDSCDSDGDVIFLESGTRGIEVSDSDTVNHSGWAWIAQPPLSYIVPHFLMWGVLFCFVYFPIFGRSRRMKVRSVSTFRNHVDAMGKLIERSNLPNRAINKIRHYQKLVSGESKRNKKNN